MKLETEKTLVIRLNEAEAFELYETLNAIKAGESASDWQEKSAVRFSDRVKSEMKSNGTVF